jgi:thiamine pyrophosphate-dependent acetolactate synthase large subunit-like protein
MNGGDLVVRMLKREGVTHAFTIIGGHNFELVNACLDHDIQVVDVRHEQQAVHMADALARATGNLAVAFVDGAPGIVNALPGMQIAYESQVPVLLCSAQGSLAGRDIGVMQAIDQLELLRPVTKWRRTCFELKRLPEYTAMAARYARSGRPGPVFLDFPLELLRGAIDEAEVTFPERYRTAARAHGDPALIEQAIALLSHAERPLVIAGSGCWWGGAGAELLHFVEQSGIPVLTRNLARGLIPDDHPLGVGFMPSGAFGADCYLIIGTRLDWTIGYGRPPLFAPEAKAIVVDIEPELIGKNRPVDLGIVGDARAVLGQLNAALAKQPLRVNKEWQARAKGSLAYLRANSREAAGISSRDPQRPMHSIELIDALQGCLTRETITVVDGGYIAAFAITMLDALAPGGVTWVGSTGHLGVGLAFANAYALAQPGRPVVALMGDGSFGLCAMEFDTAVRHNLPIIVVIANDQGWGEIRDGQRRRFGEGRVVGANLGRTRYDELARALGGHGELIERPADFGPAFERAVASGLPAILNVITDPDQRSTTVSGMPWIIE